MKVEVLDTTLRDGAQHRQVSYSSVDKLDVIAALDRLGVHYTEYGAPGFDPAAEKLSRLTLPVTRSVPVAFGMTCKKGLMPDRDENLRALVECPTPTLTLVGKSHALQVRDVLKTDLDENLRIIEQSVAYATKNDKTVIFDAEHFFDGYRYDAEYAVKTLAAAVRGGAKVLTLCDTNGGALPDDVKEITARIVERFPEVRIGIHCHNDNGLAVASTLAAVKAGATHVQGHSTLCNFRSCKATSKRKRSKKKIAAAGRGKRGSQRAASRWSALKRKSPPPFPPCFGHGNDGKP